MIKLLRDTPESRNGLLKWYEAAGRPKVLVEVGAASGESAEIFLEANPDILLFSVDPYAGLGSNNSYAKDEGYEAFMNGPGKRPNVFQIRLTSLEAAKLFPTGFANAVYLDAMHDYANVTADWRAWLPVICWNGCIGGHDYFNKFPGVQAAVDELTMKRAQIFEDHSWLFPIKHLERTP